MALSRPAVPRGGLRRAALAAAAGAALLALAPWSPARASADATFNATLFALINRDRAAHGLAPLQWSGTLSAIGESAPYGGCGFTVRGRAEDMIQRNYFAHPILGCGGRNVFDVLRAGGVGFSMAGENIGWVSGLSDPASAAQWLEERFMASPEHLANILNPAYTAVGVGSWWTSPGQVWTGAGTPLTGVVMASEEFLAPSHPPASPAGTAQAAPVRVAARTASPPARLHPAPSVTAAAAPAPTAVPTATPTPAPLVTAVLTDTVRSSRPCAPAECAPPPTMAHSRPVSAGVVRLGAGGGPAASRLALAMAVAFAALTAVRAHAGPATRRRVRGTRRGLGAQLIDAPRVSRVTGRTAAAHRRG